MNNLTMITLAQRQAIVKAVGDNVHVEPPVQSGPGAIGAFSLERAK